jgi:hypothetical protein
MGVSGSGIVTNTTVASVSGNNLTLSVAATAGVNVTLTFLPPNYSAWAGDAADSTPNNGDYGSSIGPTTFQALPNTPVTVTLPLYPLNLSVTDNPAAGVVSLLQVVDSGGGDTMTLNGTSGSVRTGLPLGQYEIEATDAGNSSVFIGTNDPVYVWILPNGVCPTTGTPLTSPCPTPISTAIAVTVG